MKDHNDNAAPAPLVKVSQLVKHFPLTQGVIFSCQIGAVRAVDGVDIEIAAGRTLGLVGESGCGKSTVGRLLLRLLEPTAGSIIFDGTEISSLNKTDLKPLRRNLQIIFQDLFSALNTRQTVEAIVGEPLYIRGMHRQLDVQGEVARVLEAVGLASYHAN